MVNNDYIASEEEAKCLDDLACENIPLFFDNNILAQVRCAPVGKNSDRMVSLVQRTYKSKTPRDLPKRLLHRARLYSQMLLEKIEENPQFMTAPEILQEYRAAVNHYKEVFQYLGGKQDSNGKVMQEFEVLIESNMQIYKILSKRNSELSKNAVDCVDTLTERIQRARLHVSQDGWYQKKRRAVEDDCALADAQLVASAIIGALQHPKKKAIVLSCDMDVANIARNIKKEIGEVEIQAYISDLDAPLDQTSYLPVSELYARLSSF